MMPKTNSSGSVAWDLTRMLAYLDLVDYDDVSDMAHDICFYFIIGKVFQ